jgi:hypothetical protein
VEDNASGVFGDIWGDVSGYSDVCEICWKVGRDEVFMWIEYGEDA